MAGIQGINDKHLDTSWEDLGQSQKDSLQKIYGADAKSTFKTARKQRMAGEALTQSPAASAPANQPAPTAAAVASQDAARTALAKTPTGSTWQDTAHANAKAGANVTDLKDYDLRSFGAGGSQTMANQAKDTMGKGKARFSTADASQLLETGNFTAQELMDFGNSLEGEDTVFGDKTQTFLKDKIAEQIRLDKEKQMAEDKPEVVAPAPAQAPVQQQAATPASTPEQRREWSSLQPAPERTEPSKPGEGGGSGGGYEYGTTDPAIKDHYLNYVHQPGDYASEATDVVDRWTKKFDNSEKVAALDHRVNQSQLYWKSRADEQTGFYLGDMWSYVPKKFEMGDPLKPVEKPDIQGMQNETMDRIESIKPKL